MIILRRTEDDALQLSTQHRTKLPQFSIEHIDTLPDDGRSLCQLLVYFTDFSFYSRHPTRQCGQIGSQVFYFSTQLSNLLVYGVYLFVYQPDCTFIARDGTNLIFQSLIFLLQVTLKFTDFGIQFARSCCQFAT